MDARTVYSIAYSTARFVNTVAHDLDQMDESNKLNGSRSVALDEFYDTSAELEALGRIHPMEVQAAKVSLNARAARFNGDPGYSEVQTKHFPVYERQPHFRGLAALQRVEEKVKS